LYTPLGTVLITSLVFPWCYFIIGDEVDVSGESSDVDENSNYYISDSFYNSHLSFKGKCNIIFINISDIPPILFNPQFGAGGHSCALPQSGNRRPSFTLSPLVHNREVIQSNVPPKAATPMSMHFPWGCCLPPTLLPHGSIEVRECVQIAECRLQINFEKSSGRTGAVFRSKSQIKLHCTSSQFI
jgi:hypothetical protein